jgi:hypothetical protein
MSDCDKTVVWVRKRSTIERTNGRTPGEVTARNLSDLALASMAMA